MKYAGWTEYAAGVSKAFSAYQSGKFTLNNDLHVHRHGNLAWATATWRAELTKRDGAKEDAERRYTSVLEKRGSEWLLRHEHMSTPVPPK
jgi:ketosteroid isomerase-like protein